MLKQTNTEIVDQHIFTQAGHLIGNNNYKEKDPTAPYKDCDRLLVDHNQKAFWFTTQQHIQHTSKLTK